MIGAPIREYAEAVAARLAFDPRLARRAREEIEDHLREAAAARPGEDAERRAIERFGDAAHLAARLASTSLAAQLTGVGLGTVLTTAVLFLAMQSRLAWYQLTEWTLCEKALPLAQLVGSFDRWSFWGAAALGAAACAAAGRRRLFLCTLAGAALTACVASDGVLTFLRLDGWAWSSDFVVPLVSMALETGCAGLLAARICTVAYRVASAKELRAAG